jgi:hypothetical protein
MSIDPMIEKKIIAPKLFWGMLEKYGCQFLVAFSHQLG